MADRRFPPPWTVEETDACFIVHDRNKQALAYVYFEEEQGAAIGGQAADERRSAADCSQYCEVAGAVETAVVLSGPLGTGQVC
jgi:hypothetical protein